MTRCSESRLTSIDGLRALAAVAVMTFHYEGLVSFGPAQSTSKSLFQYTHFALLGVELFFMLSGFVILMSAERAGSATSFLLSRAARIYPAYLVSIIPATLAALAIFGPSRHLIVQVVANLTMLQRFINERDLVTPYWTLAYELWFYIVIAIIIRLKLLPQIAVLCLAWIIVFLPLHALNRAAIFDLPGRLHIVSLIDFGSFFIIGMMSYLILTERRSFVVVACLALAILSNSLGRQDWADISGTQYFIATLLFEALLILAARSRLLLLEFRPLVWLGQRSYSLYLLHMPIGLLFWAACNRIGIGAWPALMASVPVSIGLSSLSHRYVERSGQRWLKRLTLGPTMRDATALWARVPRMKDAIRPPRSSG